MHQRFIAGDGESITLGAWESATAAFRRFYLGSAAVETRMREVALETPPPLRVWAPAEGAPDDR